MSGQPYQQRPNGPLFNNFNADRLPTSIGSPQQLAQFTAAAASGYHPRPQMKQTTYPSGSTGGFPTTDTSQPGKPKQPMSDFAASFYAAGENAAQHSSAQGSSAQPTHLQPPQAQPVDANFKGLKFITLDGFQLETREVYDQISGTFQWEMCESQDDRCISFVRDQCADKRVFLICSGSLGKKVVPEVHNLPQIYAIYIYCADVKYHREWTNSYTKVRVVCNNDDQDLLPQFAVDVAQANIEWGDALLKQNKRDIAKKKFEKALENLNKYPNTSPPTMINQVKSKLNECK
jgi:hypothetical protein